MSAPPPPTVGNARTAATIRTGIVTPLTDNGKILPTSELAARKNDSVAMPGTGSAGARAVMVTSPRKPAAGVEVARSIAADGVAPTENRSCCVLPARCQPASAGGTPEDSAIDALTGDPVPLSPIEETPADQDARARPAANGPRPGRAASPVITSRACPAAPVGRKAPLDRWYRGSV